MGWIEIEGEAFAPGFFVWNSEVGRRSFGIQIHDINHKLSFQPDWKRHQFTEKYLAVEEEILSQALVFRELEKRKYVYWKRVHDDERWVERYVRQLASRPDIKLRSAVADAMLHRNPLCLRAGLASPA